MSDIRRWTLDDDRRKYTANLKLAEPFRRAHARHLPFQEGQANKKRLPSYAVRGELLSEAKLRGNYSSV